MKDVIEEKPIKRISTRHDNLGTVDLLAIITSKKYGFLGWVVETRDFSAARVFGKKVRTFGNDLLTVTDQMEKVLTS